MGGSGPSSSWGSVVAQRPHDKGGRAGLLAFVDVSNPHASEANTHVACKTCKKKFTGTKERLAAHFAGVTNHGVEPCPNPSTEAKTLGANVLAEIETSRIANKRQKATQATVDGYLGSGDELEDKSGDEGSDFEFL